MLRRDPIGMDSHRGHDRLSDLPDCLLHGILSPLGSRQVVQTSLLSRRWRQLWRGVPCANIDEREFADDTWERFEDFADHMLTSIPPKTQLDAFRLHLTRGNRPCHPNTGRFAFSDRWIRRGLQHFPTTVDIRAASDSHAFWQPYIPPISPNTVSSVPIFNRRLTTLHLVQVRIQDGFTDYLGEYCPVLRELHMERCNMCVNAIASPTLSSLAVISPSSYGSRAGPLRLMAPRLASMRLEITYDRWRHYYYADPRSPDLEPLALLAGASIRLTGLYDHQLDQPQRQAQKLVFLNYVCSLLALLPNVANLHLSGFTVGEVALEEQSLNFPVLHNLKTLLLEECGVGTNFQVLTSIIPNTPNLEKLGLHCCIFFVAPGKKRKRGEQASKSRPPVFWCKKLESIEIKRRPEDEPHMLKVLSEIRDGMPSSWWRRVKITSTIV